ncbi:uncharacterized protein RAG0_15261 [Rhynchosporium agropyri]|uniref:F-box domain-containing protein n=1 Tax=Rhynchosporium agropyri TaxID=914238 RepID=A0A1E1LKD7_9HELO|nr:uncharacterized protein RAG0_15261 [Rhynchosporium agropyri]
MPQSVTPKDILEFFEDYPVPTWSITSEGILKTILQHLVGTNRTTCSYVDADFRTPEETRQTWPLYDRKNVVNFMHAHSSFARIGREHLKKLLYDSRVEQRCTLLKLPVEVFSNICELLSPIQRDLLPLWKFRASLSVESFATIPPPPLPDLKDVQIFRLICQKFAHAGLVNQFRAIQVRFNSESFNRLQKLAMTEHIARVTTRIAYMLPRLYNKDRPQFEELLRICDEVPPITPRDGQTRLAIAAQPRIRERFRKHIFDAMQRADLQRKIIEGGLDKKSLLQALTKFRHLDQLRIMRVEDSIDAGWVSFLWSSPSYAGDLIESEWNCASEHAKATILSALKQSNSPVHRLSSRFIDPSIVLVNLTLNENEDVSKWAAQLTSLELQLVQDSDPDTKILELSQRFRDLFSAAANLETFHVGSYHQISIPLDAIFHGLHIQNLQHLGLHLWLLDSEELLAFLQQHKSTLRSLRFRKVTLRKTEEIDLQWLKVLQYIRMNLTRLNWISLRDVNYEGAVPEVQQPSRFAPIYLSEEDSYEDSDGDSEDEEDDNDMETGQSSSHGQVLPILQHDENLTHDTSSLPGENDDAEDEHENDEDTVEEEAFEEADAEEGEEDEPYSDLDDDPEHAHERERPHTTRCQCGNGFAWNDLVDNGTSVSRKQWKMWQIWTVNRCLMHDPSSNT